MPEFNVGDRVVMLSDYDRAVLHGHTGVIDSDEPVGSARVDVLFDAPFFDSAGLRQGHGTSIHRDAHNGWRVPLSYLARAGIGHADGIGAFLRQLRETEHA